MKKMLLLILTLINIIIIGQNEDDILVKIGEKVITVEEFKHRYEFTPQVNRKYADKGKAKEELLYTLIAENLFAIEAEKHGYDTLLAFKTNYLPLEKMHLRDALYQNEISNKVMFNANSYNRGLQLANHKLFVDYIYSTEEENIAKSYQILKSNPKFDSVVILLKDVEYVNEPYEVNYGKMYPHAEEAIYNLEINEFTKPIQSPEGWYIFRLLSKMPVTFTSHDQRNSLVKNVVEGRSEDSIYNIFWNKFFVDQRITTDGTLFWHFVEKMQKTISANKTKQNLKDGEKIILSNEELLSLKNNIHPDSLNKVFIKFDNSPLTFEQFIDDFIFEGFYTFTTDIDKIASQLNSRVKRQIELELLSQESYKRGMESLPEVKSSTEIWKENYLSTLLLKDIVLNTKLTQVDIESYLNGENNKGYDTEVNILEILTDSLEIIKQALSIVNNDNSFKSFAKEHTKREGTKNSGGEFGYFSIFENGEIGKIAGTMEIGDVYGPLKTDNGYSVFKLIGKKQNQNGTNTNNIDEDTKLKIKYKKVMDNVENLVVSLAEEHNLSVNTDLLNSLDLLNTQMVVFRYMGFGGRIQAFPYSTPFFNWKNKWEQKKKDLL